jgi:hypothetical protein
MATPVGKVRAPSHKRRLVYHESPLVLATVLDKQSLSKSSSRTKLPRVTPSPQVQELQPSSVMKRQLFESPHRGSLVENAAATTLNSDLKRTLPEISVESPARRRLFASSAKEERAGKQPRSVKQVRSAGDGCAIGTNEPVGSRARVVKPMVSAAVKPLFGIKSWESVMSINSPPAAPKKSSSNSSAAGCGYRQTYSRPQSLVGEVTTHSTALKPASTKVPIPQELLTLLAPPVSMKKSGKRLLPRTHREVLRKAEARRKREVPPRSLLPRRCKSHCSFSLMEESDDDLYFDTIRHNTLPSVPHAVSTSRTQSTTSPMANSDPTDTNVSKHDEENDVRETSVTHAKRKRGRPPKRTATVQKRTQIQSRVARKRGRPVTIPPVTPALETPLPPSTVERHNRYDADTTSKRGDSPSVSDASSHSSRHDNPVAKPPPAVVKVKTSTTRSVGQSRSKAHKVRFAPTTTTFSLEIRVKTSTGSKRGKRGKVSRPTLSQSTVQTIANEITQAYLAQETAARDESEEERSDGEESASGSSTDSEPMNVETSNAPLHDKCGSKHRLKEAPAPRGPELAFDDCHDARSVASEITMDIELLQGERTIAGNRANAPARPSVDEHDDPDPRSQIARRDDDENIETHKPRKKRRVEPSNDNDATSAKHAAGMLKHSGGHRGGINSTGGFLANLPTSGHSLKADMKAGSQPRRHRWFRSTDSLASCSVASGNHLRSSAERVAKVASDVRVPGEVSVSTSRTGSLDQPKRKLAPVVPDGRALMAVEPKNTSRHEGKCGTCSGCRQVFDCLACKKCISFLQQGRRMDQGTGCLRRVCRAYRGRPMDILAGTVQPNAVVDSVLHTTNDDDGDASMSYYSDTGSVYSTASKMRRSRAARFWSRRWAEERQNKLLASSAAETKVVALEQSIDSLVVNTKKRGRGKKAKSTLHDLELPMPTDGSVASLMAGKRSLHALMHYDEADQDWI